MLIGCNLELQPLVPARVIKVGHVLMKLSGVSAELAQIRARQMAEL